MPNKYDMMTALRETGVVAVIRTETPKDLTAVARALAEGGVKFIEITMTVPGALRIIEDAAAELAGEDIFIGAGTVLDAETARAVIMAGAGYVVSPVFDEALVKLCNRYGVVVMPAGMTPTEILSAWQAGADVVKVFPANIVGPRFFKDVKGPLPQVELMPTGGVDLETAPKFIAAGACAVGAGGSLVGKELIARGDFEAITRNAREFIRVVGEAKKQ